MAEAVASHTAVILDCVGWASDQVGWRAACTITPSSKHFLNIDKVIDYRFKVVFSNIIVLSLRLRVDYIDFENQCTQLGLEGSTEVLGIVTDCCLDTAECT